MPTIVQIISKQSVHLRKRMNEVFGCCAGDPEGLNKIPPGLMHDKPEPVLQLQMGNLYAAILQVERDFSDVDIRTQQAYQAISAMLASSTSLAVENLDDTVSALSILLQRMPAGHGNMATLRDQYGCSLLARWRDRTGSMTAKQQDLDDVIASYSRSLELTLDGDPSLMSRLRNLADALQERFVRDSSSKDLSDVISTYRRCVGLTPESYSVRADILCELGDNLECSFDFNQRLQDLNDAISSYRSAVELLPEDDATKPTRLVRLANLLRRTGATRDLDDTIHLLHRAAALLQDDQPDSHEIYASLAGAFESRFDKSEDINDMRHSCLSLMQGIRQVTTPPMTRFIYAYRAVSILESNPSLQESIPLLSAYECIAESYPQAQIAGLGKNIIDRLRDLSLLPFPARGAAAAAISSGKLALALEWLEKGRNIVWGQVFQLRNSGAEFREMHPDIAARLATLSRALENASLDHSGDITFFDVSNQSGLPRVRLPDSKQAAQTKLAMEYEDLLRHVQSIDGFLKPKPSAELVAAAADGPVVLVNLHERRSDGDALILLPTEDIGHVALSQFSYAAAAHFQESLKTALEIGGLRQRGARILSLCHDNGTMADVLNGLWAHVVEPILDFLRNALGTPSEGELFRITWCATGPLAFLPLHAAGSYDQGKQSTTLMDFAISSYPPSVEALLRSIPEVASPDSTMPHVLTIAQPYALAHAPIPKTLDEVHLVRKHFPDGASLEDNSGTVDAILVTLPEHSWVHLTCHGIQHPTDPTQSAFLLNGGASLTLAQLMSLSLSHAQFAFLSACQTATGNTTVPDEAIHLAAGMLAAGFVSVVGTMWSISDMDGPVVAETFYSTLRENIEAGKKVSVAHALHIAVMQLRNLVGYNDFLRWVPFVHYGR